MYFAENLKFLRKRRKKSQMNLAAEREGFLIVRPSEDSGRIKVTAPVEGAEAQRYRWMLGEIESEAYDHPFRVVVGMAGEGNVGVPIANVSVVIEVPPYADVWFPPTLPIGQKMTLTLTTDDDPTGPPPILVAVLEYFGPGCHGQALLVLISDDPNDLVPSGLAGGFAIVGDLLADRVLTLEVFARERLVDDDHEGVVGSVCRLEETSTDQWRTHRLEVVGVGTTVDDLEPHSVGRPPLRLELAGPAGSVQGKLLHGPGTGYAGPGFDCLDELVVEGEYLVSVLVASARDRELHRQDTFTLEAGIDLA